MLGTTTAHSYIACKLLLPQVCGHHSSLIPKPYRGGEQDQATLYARHPLWSTIFHLSPPSFWARRLPVDPALSRQDSHSPSPSPQCHLTAVVVFRSGGGEDGVWGRRVPRLYGFIQQVGVGGCRYRFREPWRQTMRSQDQHYMDKVST